MLLPQHSSPKELAIYFDDMRNVARLFRRGCGRSRRIIHHKSCGFSLRERVRCLSRLVRNSQWPVWSAACRLDPAEATKTRRRCSRMDVQSETRVRERDIDRRSMRT